MKQREKIILIAALLAITYAVYVLFLSGPPMPMSISSGKQLEDARTFALDISSRIVEDDTSRIDTYIITRAATEWDKKPFLVSKQPLETGESPREADGQGQAVPFSYTGYIEAGDKTLAVISGMEYEMGEILDPGEYLIKDISLTQVIIERSDDKTTIILPMSETGTP